MPLLEEWARCHTNAGAHRGLTGDEGGIPEGPLPLIVSPIVLAFVHPLIVRADIKPVACSCGYRILQAQRSLCTFHAQSQGAPVPLGTIGNVWGPLGTNRSQ